MRIRSIREQALKCSVRLLRASPSPPWYPPVGALETSPCWYGDITNAKVRPPLSTFDPLPFLLTKTSNGMDHTVQSHRCVGGKDERDLATHLCARWGCSVHSVPAGLLPVSGRVFVHPDSKMLVRPRLSHARKVLPTSRRRKNRKNRNLGRSISPPIGKPRTFPNDENFRG